MPEDTDRPQDVGRRHGSTATGGDRGEILDRYQRTMRAELTRLLDELEPTAPSGPGLGLAAPLSVKERMLRWDLAIKVGRELGAAIDEPKVPTRAGRGAPAAGPRPIRKGDA